jgi:hypothetical protein
LFKFTTKIQFKPLQIKRLLQLTCLSFWWWMMTTASYQVCHTRALLLRMTT